MKLSTIPTQVPAEHPRCLAITANNTEVLELIYAAVQRFNSGSYDPFWAGTVDEVVVFFNELGADQVRDAFIEHAAQVARFNLSLAKFIGDDETLAARFTERAIAVPRYEVTGLFGEETESPTALIRVVAGVFEVIPPPEEVP